MNQEVLSTPLNFGARYVNDLRKGWGVFVPRGDLFGSVRLFTL
jgi:hypothetical protein